MSETYVRQKQLDAGIGEDPGLYIVELYVRFLQGLFNWMEPGHFHWEPAHEESEIIITAEAPLDREVVEKTPSIVVVMGPYQNAGMMIDNLVEQNFRTGVKLHSDLISGYLVIYALAANDVVASRIAQAAERHTRIFRRLLESEGGFHAIARSPCSINPPSPPGAIINGSPDSLFMVQANIPFQFQWSWTTEPHRQQPNLRSLAMFMQEDRARDYPYTSPAKLEKVKLAISTTPVLVRRIRGSYAVRPSTVEVTRGISPFQRVLTFGQARTDDQE